MTRKNNKGFTMIEILAAIAIMGILLMLVVPGVSKLMKGFRKDYYEELEATVIASAKEFYTDNKIYRPNGLLKSSYTSIDSLINKKYLDKLTDYKGKSCSLIKEESYVIVIYRGDGNYEYAACIKCEEDDYESDKNGTYCDPAWRTNDNIKYDFVDKDSLYVYYNTAKETTREKLLNNINIVKYNKNGEALDKVPLAEDSKENVLPIDIDKLDTSVVDKNTNMKETILHYNIENETKELKVIVYRHKAPKIELKDAKGKSYNTGTWTNKLIIKLSKNDNFFELSNTNIANFQMSIDNGNWQNIDCDMKSANTCSVVIQENVNANYKFRIITNEGRISEETKEYDFKVDVDKPSVTIDPNGDEPIVNVGSTTATIEFNLTTNDTGGSDIKSRKYAISTSDTTEPTSFINFYNDELNVSEELVGNKYYVWARVEDNAGNVSTEVWPSNVFHMKYEVIYDANGGSDAPSQSYKKHGVDLKLSSTTPTRTGYIFKGWSTTSGGEVTYAPGATYKNDEAIRLYAVWEAKTVKVTFMRNSTSSDTESDSQTFTYDKSNQSFSAKGWSKTGYTLLGWSESKDATTKTYDVTSGVTNDWINSKSPSITLYAVWEANSYTVTYDANGGSVSPESKSVTYDGTYGTLATPTRTGYTFNGWYTSSSGGTKVTSGTKVTATSDHKIYAQWTAKTVTVTFMRNSTSSDTESDSQTFTYDKSNQSFSAKGWNKTGYTLLGWSESKDATTKTYDVTSGVTNDWINSKSPSITLYAVWQANSYTVTYDANGGSVSTSSVTKDYNTSVTLPTPTRGDGYTFTGWYTAANGGTRKGDEGSKYTVTSNTTLYAQWIKSICSPVKSEWGNTSEYGAIKITALGNSVNKIYYGKYDGSAVSWNNSTTNPLTYSQAHYIYGCYARDKAGQSEQYWNYCRSLYDNLKPYTPYVVKVEPGSNVTSIDADECLKLSSTNLFDQSCTMTITKTVKTKVAMITPFLNARDQEETNTSGCSGRDNLKYDFIYTDGSTCTEYDGENKCNSTPIKIRKVTAYDEAGNVSGTLTINFVWN